MTVAELGCRMDTQELTNWMAFFELEAEGKSRQDLAGMVEQELTRARLG